jgi:hypothetical protein
MAQIHQARPRYPRDFFDNESRDEAWARAMEARITHRFAPEVLRPLGLPAMKLDSIECRATSCRIEVSWAEADAATAQAQPDTEKYGGDPLTYLSLRTGWLASLASRVRPLFGENWVPGTYFVKRTQDDAGRFSTTTILLFGDEDVDPDAYEAFAAGSLARAPLRR